MKWKARFEETDNENFKVKYALNAYTFASKKDEEVKADEPKIKDEQLYTNFFRYILLQNLKNNSNFQEID
ncbi:MAG: hypothetical protein ACRYGR_07540 [Janthinobacterium lividum]